MLGSTTDSTQQSGFQSIHISAGAANPDDRIPQLPIAALESEGSIWNVSPQDREERRLLVETLRTVPQEALPELRVFQPQTGCLNQCSFCSQTAGKPIWQLSPRGLANQIAALKTVSLENMLRERRRDCLPFVLPLKSDGTFSEFFVMPVCGLLAHRRNQRPGVVYCYLDNDPMIYSHLDFLVKEMYENLGVQIRISTVGFSRHNPKLQSMHSKINENLSDSIAGIRLSFTPYTFGWTAKAEQTGDYSRSEFEADAANLLRTYSNVFRVENLGRKTACVELRFRPLVSSTPLREIVIEGHKIVACGPYLLVSKFPGRYPLPSHLTDPYDHGIKLSQPGSEYWLSYGPEEIFKKDAYSIAKHLISRADEPLLYQGHAIRTETATLHVLKNEDGRYFAVNATRTDAGVFAKFFYPKTKLRPNGGYIDGERYVLNALFAIKKRNGIEPKESWRTAKWTDAEDVVSHLFTVLDRISGIDPSAAEYIADDVIPLIESYIRVLKIAKLPPRLFFDPRFTVDTGHICNLGSAYHEYASICSRRDMPLTPHHERAFGISGDLAAEGKVWRIAPAPPTNLESASPNDPQRFLTLEEEDLSKIATPSGQEAHPFLLPMSGLESLTQEEFATTTIPGRHPASFGS